MILLRWVIFNYLIGNCDAQAKNISMLIAKDEYRLSPFYDLLSTRAYGRLSPKFAMKIGGQYHAEWVAKEHWERLAQDAGVGVKAVLYLCAEMGETVAKLAEPAASAFAAEHGDPEILGNIAKRLAAISRKMLEVLR